MSYLSIDMMMMAGRMFVFSLLNNSISVECDALILATFGVKDGTEVSIVVVV